MQNVTLQVHEFLRSDAQSFTSHLQVIIQGLISDLLVPFRPELSHKLRRYSLKVVPELVDIKDFLVDKVVESVDLLVIGVLNGHFHQIGKGFSETLGYFKGVAGFLNFLDT